MFYIILIFIDENAMKISPVFRIFDRKTSGSIEIKISLIKKYPVTFFLFLQSRYSISICTVQEVPA